MTGVDRARIREAVGELLRAIGEDPARPGLQETPARVADAYAEFFSGLTVDPREHLADGVPVGEHDTGPVVVRDIAFRSMCEHHLLPFLGVAHLAYVPGEKVIGLGRLSRVVATLAARPQVQERLTEEIADTLDDGLAPRGALVVLDARHDCVRTRGAAQRDGSTVTVAARGSLTDPAARAELLALITAEHE